MIEFDLYGLESLVYCYSKKEPNGIIPERIWELIIAESVNGRHIPGDKYMADAVKDNIGLNVKSLKKKISKKDTQTLNFIQCRCPLVDESDVPVGVISTLVNKRNESFSAFNLDKMLDVIILHYRKDQNYDVKLFVYEQPNYENLELTWIDNKAYLDPDINKKNWTKDWYIKRNYGDSSAYQTCTYIKKKFNNNDCLTSFSVTNQVSGYINISDAKKQYSEYLTK